MGSDEGLKGVENAIKENLANLDIMASLDLKKKKAMLENILQDNKINYAYLKNIAKPLKNIDSEENFLKLFFF